MKSKMLVLVIGALFLAGSLAFAGGEKEAAAGKEGAVKIGVYSVSWSPSTIKMMQDLVVKFNNEHKGKIEAAYIQGDWDAADTYLTGGVSGGGGIADVVEYDTGGALAWYGQKFLADLTPYVSKQVRATMPEDFWKARTAADGKVFMSGTVSGEHLLLYYNPAMLEKAGIKAPAAGTAWTWDEFMANAKALTVDKNGKHIGQSGFDRDQVVQWGFLPRLDNEKIWEDINIYSMQASKKPLIRKGDDGRWDIFFDPEAMPAIRTYMSILREGITPQKAIGLSGSSQDEAFFQGTAALAQRAYFNISVLHDNYPDFKFAVMPIPMEPGSTYYSNNAGQGFVVPVVSTHKAEAAEFAFWFQKPENQALWTSALYLAPCNPKSLDDPLIKGNPDFQALRFYKSIEKIVDVPVSVNQNEFVTTVYAPAMMDALLGKITLDEAMQQIKKASKEMLNK